MNNNCFVQSADTVFTELAGEGVFLNIPTEKYLMLNKVGMDYYKLLIQNYDREEITDKLIEKYNVDKKTVQRDLQKFTSDLISAKIIERSKIK